MNSSQRVYLKTITNIPQAPPTQIELTRQLIFACKLNLLRSSFLSYFTSLFLLQLPPFIFYKRNAELLLKIQFLFQFYNQIIQIKRLSFTNFHFSIVNPFQCKANLFLNLLFTKFINKQYNSIFSQKLFLINLFII